MRTPHGTMKRIAKLGMILMMAVSMSACAGFLGFGGTNWKEEVLLHDGSKIIVKRSVERGGRHEIGQKPPYKEQSLSFTMPGTTQIITWEDHYSEDIGSASFLPMLVDVYQGTAYLVADTMGCLSYNKWGRPNPPYVIFKYQGGEWKRIPLNELPTEIKLPNLLHSSPDDVAEKRSKGGVVPATVIREENDGHPQPEYRTILREPLPGAGVRGCMEEVRTEDGWMSIDWFSSQKSYESCLKICEREKVTAQNCPCTKLFKGAK